MYSDSTSIECLDTAKLLLGKLHGSDCSDCSDCRSMVSHSVEMEANYNLLLVGLSLKCFLGIYSTFWWDNIQVHISK